MFLLAVLVFLFLLAEYGVVGVVLLDAALNLGVVGVVFPELLDMVFPEVTSIDVKDGLGVEPETCFFLIGLELGDDAYFFFAVPSPFPVTVSDDTIFIFPDTAPFITSVNVGTFPVVELAGNTTAESKIPPVGKDVDLI